MANTVIQVKRSQTTAAPPSLANGEIAYSYSSNKLFIGQTESGHLLDSTGCATPAWPAT